MVESRGKEPEEIGSGMEGPGAAIDVAVRFDAGGAVLWASEGLARLRDEEIGGFGAARGVGGRPVLPEGFSAEAGRALARALMTGVPVDFPAVVGSGAGAREYRCRMEPERSRGGAFVGTAVMLGAEVTGERRARAELEGARKRLARAEAMEALGRVAAGVAHDFHSLLTAIRGSVGLLEGEVERGTAAWETASQIRSAAEHANALAARLLGIVRGDAAAPRPVRLDEAVGELEPLVRCVAGRGIDVAFRLDPGTGRVFIDRVALCRLLLNLVVNARDAMSDGGRLTIATEPVEADPTDAPGSAATGRSASHARLTVADTGPGIPCELRERLFEPFVTGGDGTGVGLNTVAEVVSECRGRVEVSSDPSGTRIVVSLPRIGDGGTAGGEEEGG